MPDRPDETPRDASHELSEEVGARERRKVRARSAKDRTLWVGLGTFGVVGWSVAVPTVIGIVLGLWFARIWPGRTSWTLALFLGGVSLVVRFPGNWLRWGRKWPETQGIENK